MKTKMSISIIFLFISVSLFSQIKKGDREVSLNAGVYFNNSGISETPMKFQMRNFTTNSEFCAKYYLKDFLSVGLGLKYRYNNKRMSNSLYSDSIIYEIWSTKVEKIIIPSIQIGYNFEILKRFYIKGILSANYGIASLYEESIYYFSADNVYNISNNSLIRSEIFNETEKYNYVSIELKPKLQYYFNNRIGLTLGLGEMEYLTDDELFYFTFGPAYWTLGLDVKF